ncbi:MAG: cytochrome c oxidase subunit 3 [Thermoanaerobaculia bacterium]
MSEAIPYTVDARPDTGLNNVKIGIWLFLASEVMLFGALFATYILLRLGAEHWPHGAEELSVPLGAFNTIILIGSSVTMVMSWASLMRRQPGRYRLYMGLTVFLGLFFLVNKGIEYYEHIHHGEVPATSTFLAIYFTLTGLHALHVLCGTLVNAWLLAPGFRFWRSHPEQFANRVEAAGLFWHFVDLVWIFLFPVLYLL